MKTNLEIAWKFIVSRKRSMLMTLCGIVFGVAFFIITQAQTSGFQQFFIQTILGTNGAIRITDQFQDTLQSMVGQTETGHTFQVRTTEGVDYVEGVEYPHVLIPLIREYPEVIGVSEILEKSTPVSSGFRTQTGRILGIRLNDHLQVSELANQIIQGRIENFAADPKSIIIGTRLAERLNLRLYEFVSIDGKNDTRKYQVVAIFESGVEQIDKQFIYMDLTESRSLMEVPFGEALLQIAIRTPEKAEALALQMQNEFNHITTSWQEREKVWLDVFRALRYSSAITVSTIILLSGIGMFNTLAMMVIEKTREIAILRSMGYTPVDVSQIFLFQGTIILTVGIIFGWIGGAALTYGISKIPLRIRGIFQTDHFVVSWDFAHYIAAGMVAVVVVFIASYIPARRAARVEPASIIRGTS